MFKRLIRRYKNEIMTAGIIILLFASIGYFNGRAEAERSAQLKKMSSAAVKSPVVKVEEPPAEQPKQQYTEVTLTATAYCPCVKCCGKSDGITATGTKATAGRTIAADPSVFPYGTKMIIYGQEYTVEDCGGAIKGNRIDIYFATHQEALNFGCRTLTAKVLR